MVCGRYASVGSRPPIAVCRFGEGFTGERLGCINPETTKPSHFCEGFVLYGAAPGVEKTELFYIYQRVKNKNISFLSLILPFN